MGTNYKHGFTIIETVLFLAVSSALAIGILAGSNMAINQQRYRDSVSSLKSEIQQQFGEVANVNNSRGTDWACQNSAETEQNSATNPPRGASECVVMGRYIKSYDDSGSSVDGSRLYIYSVIGHLKNNPPLVSTDTDAIQNYDLRVTSFGAQVKPLEWDATIRVLPAPAVKPNTFSILILRSPLTGAVRTYVPETGKTFPDINLDSQVVTDDNLIYPPLRLCVDAPLGVFTGGKMAVQLSANASNQSAVETVAEGNGC